MTVAHCWMPDNSLRDQRATQPVSSALADWSAHWFVEARCEIFGEWNPAGAECGSTTLLRDTDSWLISGEKGAVLQIGSVMVGEAGRTDWTSADLRLLRRMGGEALDDLSERLEAMLPRVPGGSAVRSGEPWLLKVRLSDKPCLELSLDRALLSRLVRQGFFPAMRPVSLAPLHFAIDEVAVPVAGRLGMANLDLEQIAGLEPGDILLLDQLADDPVGLVVAESEPALPCTVAMSGDLLCLTMTEPR